MKEVANLKGIVVPVITPIDHQERVDGRSVPGLTAFLLQGGVHAVFVLGSTGEFAFLGRTQKIAAAESFARAVEGRVPLLVNISEEGTSKSLDFYREVKHLPITAVVALAPYYFRIADQEELLRHFLTIAEHVEVPLLMYNIPKLAGHSIPPEVVWRCAKHENVIGIKDSSSDFRYFGQILAGTRSESFAVFQGDEQLLLASLMLGASGGVNTLANVAPRVASELYHSWEQRDTERAIELQKKYSRLSEFYHLGKSPFAALKTALHLRGLCSPHCCAPLEPLSDPQVDRVRVILAENDL